MFCRVALALGSNLMSERGRVENTVNRFMNSFDLKDWRVMKEMLADELRIDYSDLRGEPESVVSANDYVQARRRALEHLSTHHLIANLDVAIDGEDALVHASCMIYRTDGATPFNSHAFYTFVLRRIADGWRIAGIKQKILWNEGSSAIHKGAR
jgi:SnoaL-like domain